MTTTPTLQALLIAVLSFAGGLVGASLQYIFGQRLEARKQLGVQKAQAYADFFRAMSALAQDSSKEQLTLATDAKTRICIYGFLKVVQNLGAFEKAGANATTTAGQAALVALMEAMREDVTGAESVVQKDTLLLVLFGKNVQN